MFSFQIIQTLSTLMEKVYIISNQLLESENKHNEIEDKLDRVLKNNCGTNWQTGQLTNSTFVRCQLITHSFTTE